MLGTRRILLKTITVQELADLGGDVDLLDVRTPKEFRAVHSTWASNEPLDRLDPRQIMEKRSTERPLYLICKSGGRSAKAQQQFVEAGFENVINVEGGTDAWVTLGLPVIRGPKAMSLERQVRIAAGFITLAGAATAFMTNNIYLVGIPAFIGAGLMFAGITDTCGMGMIIAKMPWNQVRGEQR